MKKKRDSGTEQTQYRIRYRTADDITPVEKHFMAISLEQALEIFSYSCRDFQTTPELVDFAKWNRWANEWDFDVPKEVAQQQIQSNLENLQKAKGKAVNGQGTSPDNSKSKLLKELEINETRYNDPYYFIRGKPNPKYKLEIDRINQMIIN